MSTYKSFVTTPESRTPWRPWATIGLGLAILAINIVVGVLLAIIISLVISGSLLFHNNEGFILSVSTIISNIIGIILVIFFTKLRHGPPIAEYLGLRRIRLKSIFYSLFAVTVLIILSDGLSFILKRPLSEQSNINDYNTSIIPALLWVAVVVFAPVFEELLFRGFLFEGLKRSKIGTIGTIILTAAGWSLLHIGYDAYAVASIFIGGIVLGIARYRTNSLLSTIIMHVFANIVATVEIVINIDRLLGLR
jgi:uncharacterized protein